MPAIWTYPPDVLAALSPLTPEQREEDRRKLSDRVGASLARLTRQVAANVALEKERIAALEWCRANGNPHRPKETPNDD